MILKEQSPLEWLEFELFSSCRSFKHAVFSRKGGVSLPPFSGLNLSHNVNDDPAAIALNASLVQQVFAPAVLVPMKQVHGNRVVRVDGTFQDAPIGDADGLMTNCKGLALVALHADCQIAIFYDPLREAIALVHAGWRGLVQEIYAECIRGMQIEFGSKPADLLVAISPSLGPAHSEFINHAKELPESWAPFREKECHFNLWEIAKWQLLQQGILSCHLQIAGICTYANSQDYFSYRRDKMTGRNATVAALC